MTNEKNDAEQFCAEAEDDPLSRFNCSLSQWQDWKWQMKNRIRTIDNLKKYIKIEEDIDSVIQKYPMSITPYYLSLIKNFSYSDPIFAQMIPNQMEMKDNKCLLSDPLDENGEMPVHNLVHRYTDRALIISTSTCSAFCRFCTRKRIVGVKERRLNNEQIKDIKEYLIKHDEIKDVIISGGDPFVQSDRWIENLLKEIRDVKSVEIIRFGTRTPVVLPQRINKKLVNILKKYHPVWVNTHFNHPSEITQESIKACQMLVDNGIPVGNQSVLLNGVNDSSVILEELYRKLVKIRVRPYYLYQCDLVKGLGHFIAPLNKGIEIMKNLRGRLSGFAIPTFIVDSVGGKGKIPINPQYVVKNDDGYVVLKNYKDEIIEYKDIY